MKDNIFVPKDPTKYELARRLYFDSVPLKDIAKRIGITPQTLTNWKQKGGWEERRKAQLLSPKVLYEKLLGQLSELIDQGAPRETADAISKICKQVKELQRDTTAEDIINAITDMSDWIVKNGKSLNTTNEFFRELTRIQDLYIQTIISKQSPLD